jgi:hypothetical protein
VPRYDRQVSGARVFALSVHADYACRHSGACCTAGWSIPVEPRLRKLIGTERLDPVAGACPQYDFAARRCRIHRDHGESMLPESCDQFPRRTVIDPRGTFVTLSHFCPTAASQLLDATGPLEIVGDPPAFPARRLYDGLDATGEWPPLVRPDVLFDYVSYDLWERFLVRALGRASAAVSDTLGRVARAAEQLRTWTPARGSLDSWTAAVVGAEHEPDLPPPYHRFAGTDAWTFAVRSVPAGLDAPAWPDGLEQADAAFVAPAWDALAPLLMRYVATKAFASWSAYQGRGVRTHVAELLVTTAVLRVECARACGRARRRLDRDTLLSAIRASDWLLMHLVDRPLLMEALGDVEHHAPLGGR